MARKKTTHSPSLEEVTFEEAYAKLEEIVRLLEEGQLGLSDSLGRYEEGIKYLKHCHGALEQAERKINLLTGFDAEGNPVTEPFDDEELTLEEKRTSRSQRRSRGANSRDDDADAQKGLF